MDRYCIEGKRLANRKLSGKQLNLFPTIDDSTLLKLFLLSDHQDSQLQ